MKVKELRDELENALNTLDDYDDEDEVNLVSNTYFLGYCHTFLGIAGYNGGYVNLEEPVKYDEEDEEAEE